MTFVNLYVWVWCLLPCNLSFLFTGLPNVVFCKRFPTPQSLIEAKPNQSTKIFRLFTGDTGSRKTFHYPMSLITWRNPQILVTQSGIIGGGSLVSSKSKILQTKVYKAQCLPCVSRTVAFIVKNIKTIINLHVLMANLILHMLKFIKKN